MANEIELSVFSDTRGRGLHWQLLLENYLEIRKIEDFLQTISWNDLGLNNFLESIQIATMIQDS